MSTSRRLLMVDDEESFRQLTARELERSGYSVHTAGSLKEAREALATGSFHVVLLDVRMPDGSGLDLLPEIRDSYPGTDVVMLTAYGTVQEAIRAMKQGAHDFLTKPAKFAELEAVLDKGLVAIVADANGFHGLITRFDLLNHLRRTLS